jgi:uncharacterized repeat protein (TIGR01451 family)
MRNRLAVVAVIVTLSGPTARGAERFGRFGSELRGRLDFVFVGATMADNTGLPNGVRCLKPSATAHVRPAALPQKPRLISATLYLGGSLIQGSTFAPGDVLFNPPSGLSADSSTDRPIIEALAVQGAAKSVSFRPPGAAQAVTVSSDQKRGPFISLLYKGSPAYENLAFFLTPIDVTAVINDAGGGILEGDYEVSGLRADVCKGNDIMCSDVPGAPSCGSAGTGSTIHTNGAASFALLLVVEDLSLPQRSVNVFEGLVDVSGPTGGLAREQVLSLSSPVSSPASGSLAIYGLEGDLLLPTLPVDAGPCHADEYVEVDGDLDPTSGGLCLVDEDNPQQNLFNGSLNQEPGTGPFCPAGATQPFQCCNGPHVCGMAGVDIDRFNISSALVPGVTTVRTSIKSGQDQVYLAALVLGIDVFEPTLQEDTQIRVFDPDTEGNVRLGGPIAWSIAVSNTGNVPADGVQVVMDMPANVTGFTVERLPAGGTDQSVPEGGANGNGRLIVTGFNVQPGKVAEIRVRGSVPCLVARTLAASAKVSSLELAPFTVTAPVLTTRGPGLATSACPGLDADGPFAVREDPNRALRGGGGCSDTGSSGLWAAFAAVFLLAWRRRHALLPCALCLIASSSCATRHEVTPPGQPPSGHIDSLDGLPGERCFSPLMVVVTRADGTRFCIDRFEASVDAGALGHVHQAGSDGTTGDDATTTTDGSTLAHAQLALATMPAAGVSWYQAKAACANARKRLCTVEEWELACRGPGGVMFPYGNDYLDKACNGFFAYTGLTPAATGSFASCGSAFGAYDLSGNLEEWTDTSTERIPGSGILLDRAVRGGSYASNAQALVCGGPEYHSPPAQVAADRGFRCCSEAP